jgi:hypothetical protein
MKKRTYSIILLALLVASCIEGKGDSSFIIPSKQSDFGDDEGKKDTLYISQGNDFKLDLSNYPEADLVHIDFVKFMYLIKVDQNKILDVSSKTLTPVSETPLFKTFNKGDMFILYIGKSEDSSPLKITVENVSAVIVK